MLKVFLDKVSVPKEYFERVILKDIVFKLEENNIYTILGKNGSGKTTLLKSLTKLLDERFYSVDGKVLFNEENIFEMKESELLEVRRKDIRYIFQDPVNSFDHLKTFGYYFNQISSGSEVGELLEYFLLPDSKTLFKMYPYEVSGGMAQRISFILTLLSHPKIIFLDEPASGIDAPITNLMLLKLKEFIKEKDHVVLLVTQDLDFAKSASDKISLLLDRNLSPFKETKEFFKEHIFEV